MWPAVAATSIALASVFSYPDEGSEPMGRAGAWVARASDPIALARNPAGLAGQPLRMSAGWDLAFRHPCVGEVCDDGAAFPVGFFALSLPVSRRFTIGTGIVTPHGIPNMSSKLLDSTTLFAIPTWGVGWEVAPDVRIGASFGWGMATVRTVTPEHTIYGDYEVTALTRDLFIPRLTLGAHARANDWVEVGASFMASAPYSGSGEGRASATTFVEHRFYDHVDVDIAIPMEASIGVRARVPRRFSKGDPIDTEVADFEIDTTWSDDAAIDGYGRSFRNVIGFRAGGDVNVVPGVLALRAGLAFTPRSGDPRTVALETMSGTRVALSVGATARIEGQFDLSVAFLHMFIDDVGPLRDGLDVMHLGVAYRF